MRQNLLACVVSALFGGVVVAWLMTDSQPAKVSGQESQLHPEDLEGTHLDPRRHAGGVISPTPFDRRRTTASVPVATDLSDFTAEERVNITVYERDNRGVVHITTKSWSPDMFFEGPTDGAGSGSVLDEDGHILTNYHVVEGANEIRVTLFNGESFEAGLVGRDPPNDIAVLRIDAEPESLYPIALGDSSGLRVGQKALAIGNPFGLERTLTVGILSSLNRRLPSRTGREMKSIIQIDAALNQGNSGGPLLSSRGLLIGMNTAIASRIGENTGVGFAIPVNTIKRVVPQLIEHGRVIRPVIGIASVYETENGLVIIELVSGGPAERAGLRGFRYVRQRERRGPYIVERSYVDRDYADVIIAIDERPVSTGDQLLDVVESKKPGDRVVVQVQREDRMVEVPVILGTSE